MSLRSGLPPSARQALHAGGSGPATAVGDAPSTGSRHRTSPGGFGGDFAPPTVAPGPLAGSARRAGGVGGRVDAQVLPRPGAPEPARAEVRVARADEHVAKPAKGSELVADHRQGGSPRACRRRRAPSSARRSRDSGSARRRRRSSRWPSEPDPRDPRLRAPSWRRVHVGSRVDRELGTPRARVARVFRVVARHSDARFDSGNRSRHPTVYGRLPKTTLRNRRGLPPGSLI